MVEVNRLENEGDRILREAVATLFDHGIDPMMVIRWKDIYERLEDAIDATEAAMQHHVRHHHQEPVVHSDVVLWIVVATAIAFDFTNGFHDTANAIATSVSTRALSPRFAVAMAAGLNFVGAFLSLAVAATIAKGIVDAAAITLLTVFAGLVGAIAWNLATWWFGLPSSSSHALIGGMVGATLASQGSCAVLWNGLVEKVAVPALVAPVLALVAAGLAILVAYRIIGRQSPGVVSRGFRLGQLASSALFSLSHGTNDAQKTMGIIFLALVANGNMNADAGHPDLGDRLLGERDRARHLLRRLADRAHDGLEDHQDGPGAGLRGAGRGRRGDPVGVARRLPAVDHARDERGDHGRGRRQAALRGALGRRGEHRARRGC